MINVIWTVLIGTYGTVFKAKNKETHEIVALKRVRLDDDDEVGQWCAVFVLTEINSINGIPVSLLDHMFMTQRQGSYSINVIIFY